MTNEQYKEFEPYEKQLRQATYHNYVTNLPRPALQHIHEIYQEITGDIAKVNYGCGACQLKLLKRVGDLYFKYKASLVKEEKKEEEKAPTLIDSIKDRMAKARAAKKNKSKEENK